ncbi:unnamed protein product [Rangifer tarandus platyrhynchus]|uniref:Uncharacterized protein n=1 Tax=Rangifer tarandus platyrhynchus TaxID=3082113 RepID=A0AC59YDW7_RANTA
MCHTAGRHTASADPLFVIPQTQATDPTFRIYAEFPGEVKAAQRNIKAGSEPGLSPSLRRPRASPFKRTSLRVPGPYLRPHLFPCCCTAPRSDSRRYSTAAARNHRPTHSPSTRTVLSGGIVSLEGEAAGEFPLVLASQRVGRCAF